MKIKSITTVENLLCSDREPFLSTADGKDVTLSVRTDMYSALIEVTLTEDDLKRISAFMALHQADL